MLVTEHWWPHLWQLASKSSATDITQCFEKWMNFCPQVKGWGGTHRIIYRQWELQSFDGQPLSFNYFLIFSHDIDNGSSSHNLFKCKTVDEVQKQKNFECNIPLLQPSRIVSTFSSSDFQVWNWVWNMICNVVERIGTNLATPDVCLLISCMILKQRATVCDLSILFHWNNILLFWSVSCVTFNLSKIHTDCTQIFQDLWSP